MIRSSTEFPVISPFVVVCLIVIVVMITTLCSIKPKRGQEDRLGTILGVVLLLTIIGVPIYMLAIDPFDIFKMK